MKSAMPYFNEPRSSDSGTASSMQHLGDNQCQEGTAPIRQELRRYQESFLRLVQHLIEPVLGARWL
jgi:hypothetical protein